MNKTTLATYLTWKNKVSMSSERKEKQLLLLLQRLQNGRTVQNRDLQTWLSSDVYSDYMDECAQQTLFRTQLKDKPTEVVEYETRLKRALFIYNKAEGASVRGRKTTAKRYFNEADSLFERALEHLGEIIGADQSLCVWFDRDTTYEAGGEVSIDPHSVPRVVTSRSFENRGGGLLSMLQSKRDLKISAIERELASLSEAASTVEAKDMASLKARIKAFTRFSDSD